MRRRVAFPNVVLIFIMPYHCIFLGKIISLLESGKTVHEVAQETGLDIRTIQKWDTRFENEGEAGMKETM